jgi:hypothetical protein
MSSSCFLLHHTTIMCVWTEKEDFERIETEIVDLLLIKQGGRGALFPRFRWPYTSAGTYTTISGWYDVRTWLGK